MALLSLLAVHVMHVNARLKLWRELLAVDMDLILDRLEDEVYTDEHFWWREFWGTDVLADVTDASIDANEDQIGLLQHFPNLTGLQIYGNTGTISAETLRMIRERYPNLIGFALSNVPLDVAARRELAQFEGLEYLDLYGVNIEDDDLIELLDRSRLVKLSLTHCRQVTDRGLSALERQPEILRVYLDGMNVTDEGLRWLARCKKIVSLDLTETQVTGEGL